MGFIILAVFSLSLMIALMTGLINPAPMTCFVYRTFSAANPDIVMPTYCLTEDCSIQRDSIKSLDPEQQATYLAAYSVACYTSKRSPCPKTGHTAICYEIRMTGGIFTSELEMTGIMERDYESGCLLLPNSMVIGEDGLTNYPGSCGDEDRLDWQLTGNEAMVVIEYDTRDNKVVLR